MDRFRLLLGLTLVGISLSCGGGSAPKPDAPAAKTTEKKGPEGLMVFAPGPRPKAPSGCEWVVNQTELPGAEVLLYLAAKCNGKTTTLHYSATAEKALFSYGEGGPAVVEMMGIENEDGDAAILRHARAAMDAKTKTAKCAVRLAKQELWPADAKVVDVSAAEAAKAPKDEPRSACGKYGLDEDAQLFWRVFQGFAWYFNLGQEDFVIDPGSLTLVSRDEAGNWSLYKH